MSILQFGLAFGCRHQIDVVDQAQIDDVDEQLGIDDLLQLFADEVFDEAAGWRRARRADSASLCAASGSRTRRRRASSRCAASPRAAPAAAAGRRPSPAAPGSQSRTQTSSPSTLHLVGRGIDGGGHRQRLAGADVELRPVPRAGDRVIVERAFGERPAVVRADVVDAEELAADAEQHDDPIVDLEQHLAGIGEVGRFGNADEVGHDAQLSRQQRRRGTSGRQSINRSLLCASRSLTVLLSRRIRARAARSPRPAPRGRSRS